MKREKKKKTSEGFLAVANVGGGVLALFFSFIGPSSFFASRNAHFVGFTLLLSSFVIRSCFCFLNLSKQPVDIFDCLPHVENGCLNH